MINKSKKVSKLENIYKNLESGMPENKSIKDYALPNARQWLGGRYVALWVLPIYLIRKIAEFVASSAFIKPYSPSKNGPSYKRPETLYTSLKGVFRGEDHLRFFDHRFIAIWVLPIYLIGKISKFAASSAFIKPYSPINNGPSYKRPETLYTSLKGVFKGEDHLRFFDHRFIAIWVLPIALTGIVFEVLFISPTKNTFPFN